jgi:short subunit fatty acids transporter
MHTITYLDVIIQVFLQKLTRHIRKVMPDPFDLAAIVFFFRIGGRCSVTMVGSSVLMESQGAPSLVSRTCHRETSALKF